MCDIDDCLPRFPEFGSPPMDPIELDNDKFEVIAECEIPHDW